MTYDPCDPKSRGAALAEVERRAAVRLAQAREDIAWLMWEPRGRRFVLSLLDASGVFDATFSQNAIEMAFLDGRRFVGVQLMIKLLDQCPEQFIQARKEQENDRHNTGR